MDDGFVLLIVLWALILTSLIAAATITTARLEAKAASTIHHAAEMEVLADGMIRLTALRLTDRSVSADGTHRVAVNGMMLRCREGHAVLEIQVEDAAGRVDLNAASPSLLARLLRGVGLAPEEAIIVAGRIQDYRDLDDVSFDGGSELSQYRQSGRPFGPKNALFDSTDELDQVPGITPALLSVLRPLLTVHSQLPGIDPNVTSQAVSRTLTIGSVGGRGSPDLADVPIVRSPSRSFHISVAAKTGRTLVAREAVVVLQPRAPHGFVVRELRGGKRNASPPEIPAHACFR